MNTRQSQLRTLVSLCVVVGGLLFVWSAPAFAQRMHEFGKSFGSEGSGDGQLTRPGALAVDDATGDVYVIDRGNGRVEIFDSQGEYVSQFNGSDSPTGAFSWPTATSPLLEPPEGAIAVDNSRNPLDPSAGDVYVLDTGHNVIDKFGASGTYLGQFLPRAAARGEQSLLAGVAVAPSGAFWDVEENLERERLPEVDQFNDAEVNEFVTEKEVIFPYLLSSSEHPGYGEVGLTVGSEDEFYVGKIPDSFVVLAKFASAGGLLQGEIDDEKTTGSAVDSSSDDVYLDHETSVAAYGPAGAFIERFGSAQMSASEGIAVDSATGTIYAANTTNQEIDVFAPIIVPDATTESASNFAETTVTVGGSVDPDGLPVTSCEFEYGTTGSYGQSAPCVQAPAQIGAGEESVAVSAQLTGLQRLTGYHFRLKVANANGSNAGQDRTFLTPEPVAISEAGVSDISSSSALFSAYVDPGGADTRFHFEYGTSTAYGESVPVPDGDLGSGTSSVLASIRAQDLAPQTTYHVRLVATNLLGSVDGPDGTFKTQVGGGVTLGLPDGREWEMVSPPSKYGAGIEPLDGEALIEAAEDGDAISYLASGPVVPNPAGNSSPVEKTQVLSRRGANGWSSEDLVTPHVTVTGPFAAAEYVAFSSDLSQALVEPAGTTPLSTEATEKTVYLRHDNDSYTPLVTASNTPPGTKIAYALEDEDVHGVLGTPDLSHVLLQSQHPLTSNAIVSHTTENIYEWTAGRLQLVNVLPDGTATEGGQLGDYSYDARHALSSDGSRVFWSQGQSPDHQALYMRDTVTEQTTRIDTPAPGVSPSLGSAARFETASANGSMVFFFDELPLTLDSKLTSTSEVAGSSDLYAYDTETGVLTDLTVDPNGEEQANVQDMVLGASESGSEVYFVATGKLAEGAESGKDNLYVESESGSTWSTPQLVAVLSEEDSYDWGAREGEMNAAAGGVPSYMTAMVSPNGRYLAFMSDRSLTGYDNIDANSGHPDEEVFLYDETTGHLLCASCNPTGARPDGVFNDEELLVAHSVAWKKRWLAASIPGWEGIHTASSLVTYQPRFLSNDGRLFFDSADALIPQDTNGREDVYEYEPVGDGGASGCTAGGPAYVESASGCLSLISSGTSSEESAFLDASSGGDDVFFLTASRLVAQDVDTGFDVYDAHVCSVGEPCVNAPVSPPECTTGDSCKPAPSPQPAVFGAPASATFSGAGNVTPAPVSVGTATAKKSARPKKHTVKRSSHHKHVRSHRHENKGSRAKKSLSIRTRR